MVSNKKILILIPTITSVRISKWNKNLPITRNHPIFGILLRIYATNLIRNILS